jgi:hypothetical protein
MAAEIEAIINAAPGHQATPRVKAAFVRRKGDYGFGWPGAIYDGEAALKNYTQEIQKTSEELGLDIEIEPQPIYDNEAADSFINQLTTECPDGALVVLLDRQQHAWPTANRVIETGIPTIVFAPIGAAFTTNVREPAKRTGAYVVSSMDFDAVKYGLKMIKAHKQMCESNVIILRGDQRSEKEVENLGTKLKILPVEKFGVEYDNVGSPTARKEKEETEEVRAIAQEYVKQAQKVVEPSESDVINAAKTYVAAKRILEQEQGDAIAMDCLGPARRGRFPVPCLAWSKLNDAGIPAGCEADLNATLTQMLVQYLFDKPGFQQDPVPETVQNALIGAHCSCPTKLNGFQGSSEPFNLRCHHSRTGVAPQVLWHEGQEMTIAGFMGQDKMLVYSGKVLGNVSIPPAGGCLTSVIVEVEGISDVVDVKGFHQIFFYGNHERQLRAYCQMFGIQAQSL